MIQLVACTSNEAVDVEVLEESALAMAQSAIQTAMNESGVSRSEMARRMKCDRSFISRMLAGNHNLTVRTMTRAMAACGFEVRFRRVLIEWHWADARRKPPEKGAKKRSLTRRRG